MIVRQLTLPPRIVEAVEQKLFYEQQAAAYRFRLPAEHAEAERLEIKGDGLRRYYTTVNSALTPPLLTWRGIEATVELAQSSNAKIVIVGSGRDQLPLILGSDLVKPSGEAPAAPRGAPRVDSSPERRGPPLVGVPPEPEVPTTPPRTQGR